MPVPILWWEVPEVASIIHGWLWQCCNVQTWNINMKNIYTYVCIKFNCICSYYVIFFSTITCDSVIGVAKFTLNGSADSINTQSLGFTPCLKCEMGWTPVNWTSRYNWAKTHRHNDINESVTQQQRDSRSLPMTLHEPTGPFRNMLFPFESSRAKPNLYRNF